MDQVLYDNAEALAVSEEDSQKEWILDSGCSFHACPNKGWFENYKQIDGGTVLLGNSKSCKVIGIGSLRIRMHNNKEGAGRCETYSRIEGKSDFLSHTRQ